MTADQPGRHFVLESKTLGSLDLGSPIYYRGIKVGQVVEYDFDEDAEPRNAGNRLAGSYVNFYIANGGIIVPLFDDKYDEPAMKLITKVFPDRKVVGVPGREILLCGGCVHCITQQHPSGK